MSQAKQMRQRKLSEQNWVQPIRLLAVKNLYQSAGSLEYKSFSGRPLKALSHTDHKHAARTILNNLFFYYHFPFDVQMTLVCDTWFPWKLVQERSYEDCAPVRENLCRNAAEIVDGMERRSTAFRCPLCSYSMSRPTAHDHAVFAEWNQFIDIVCKMGRLQIIPVSCTT